MLSIRTALQSPRRRALVTTAVLAASLAGALAGLSACSGDPAATESSPADLAAPSPIRVQGEALSASANRQLAALRAATAGLHRFEQAAVQGWNEQFPPGCFTDESGAMGFHYIKGGNVGTLDAARPQLVLYEPQADGSRKLVGVEYIYPGEPTDTPPVLFDQPFTWNTQFKVWALHAWVWKHNRDGMFASWNPDVSCAHAGVIAATSHH